MAQFPEYIDWVGTSNLRPRAEDGVLKEIDDLCKGSEHLDRRAMGTLHKLPDITVHSGQVIDTYVIGDVTQLFEDAGLGMQLSAVLRGLGGVEHMREKTGQMSRVAGRRFGGLWLWANEITAHAHHRVLANYSDHELANTLEYLCMLIAWDLCERTRHESRPKGARGAEWAMVRISHPQTNRNGERYPRIFMIRWPKRGERLG